MYKQIDGKVVSLQESNEYPVRAWIPQRFDKEDSTDQPKVNLTEINDNTSAIEGSVTKSLDNLKSEVCIAESDIEAEDDINEIIEDIHEQEEKESEKTSVKAQELPVMKSLSFFS